MTLTLCVLCPAAIVLLNRGSTIISNNTTVPDNNMAETAAHFTHFRFIQSPTLHQ